MILGQLYLNLKLVESVERSLRISNWKENFGGNAIFTMWFDVTNKGIIINKRLLIIKLLI